MKIDRIISHGNEFDAEDFILGEIVMIDGVPYQIVSSSIGSNSSYFMKVERDEKTVIGIPKKIAELADIEFNRGATDALDFGYLLHEDGLGSETLKKWLTDDYYLITEQKLRCNILAIYLASKALGVKFVEVVDDE